MDEEKFQKTFTEREIKFHITSTVRTASNFLTAKPGAGPTPEVLWHPLHSLKRLSSSFINSDYTFSCSFLPALGFPGPPPPRNHLPKKLPAAKSVSCFAFSTQVDRVNLLCQGLYDTFKSILHFYYYAKFSLIIFMVPYTIFSFFLEHFFIWILSLLNTFFINFSICFSNFHIHS